MTTDTNNSIVQQTATAAASLMTAGGRTCEITGLALSTVATLYMMQYMTTAGCTIVEFIPQLLETGEEKKSFKNHWVDKNRTTIKGVFVTAAILTTGIFLRKGGSTVSSPSVINWMENFLYRNK